MRNTGNSYQYSERFYIYTKTALYLGATSSIALGLYLMFRRYHTSSDIPQGAIKNKRKFYGYVVKVSDGDTIRVYHTPLWQWFGGPPDIKRGTLTKSTVQVRLSAVDAPEVAHFGKPAQPLSEEATQCLSGQIMGKRVAITPLAKDQYGRLVGTVSYRQFFVFKRNASHEILRQGLATIYRGGNAQYDGEKELLEDIEREAKRSRRGIWGLKKGEYESPAEYKRKHR